MNDNGEKKRRELPKQAYLNMVFLVPYGMEGTKKQNHKHQSPPCHFGDAWPLYFFTAKICQLILQSALFVNPIYDVGYYNGNGKGNKEYEQ